MIRCSINEIAHYVIISSIILYIKLTRFGLFLTVKMTSSALTVVRLACLKEYYTKIGYYE